MTSTEVRSEASELGFVLEQIDIDGDVMWTWSRGNDRSWPAFLTQDAAESWMNHALRTASLFNHR